MADENPGHVAIVGLGPSAGEFLRAASALGGRRAYCDQVWGINAVGGVLDCDLIFHMDDVRIQTLRAEADLKSPVVKMLCWMRQYKGRILTSRVHGDFPCLEAFPLQEVLDTFQLMYFNSTVAYAIAYAVLKKATRISLFGIDFSYADSHRAEKGRACVEFWMGVAHQRGILLTTPNTTPLLDACDGRKPYGYDTLDIAVALVEDGRRVLSFTESQTVPTAAEIEARYDHTRPTVPTPAET